MVRIESKRIENERGISWFRAKSKGMNIENILLACFKELIIMYIISFDKRK